MKIDILTLFPEMFKGPFSQSIIKRAQDKGLVDISIHNLRDWAEDKHKTVDDRPYGGGAGMILRVDIIDVALQEIKSSTINHKSLIILLDAGGKKFDQKKAAELSKFDNLIIICGHYEGIDARVESLVDEVVSIGDFVLTGGEIPAMTIVDCLVRLIPGVLEKPEATELESFSLSTNYKLPTTILEYPQYTRPENFKGQKVPEVLLSGNHKEIESWRKQKSLEKTKKARPDLLNHQ